MIRRDTDPICFKKLKSLKDLSDWIVSNSEENGKKLSGFVEEWKSIIHYHGYVFCPIIGNLKRGGKRYLNAFNGFPYEWNQKQGRTLDLNVF